MQKNLKHIIYGVCIIACFTPYISPAIALATGIFLSALNLQNEQVAKYRTSILQISIVLMGFGMNLSQVLATSKTGFTITVVSVVGTLTLGIVLGKIFKVEKITSLLISCGTAICGGSAIAAISPVVGAKDNQISFSLVVVFVLNAIALFIFPIIGHYFNLSQDTFGYWAAIAIHDTSSVVGAGAAYGSQALETATIVKLTRALWIVPLSLAMAWIHRKNKNKIKLPWFILLFVLAILFSHFIPQLSSAYSLLDTIGKRSMVVAIFLIGSNLSLSEIKKAGAGSFLQGILLWIIVSSISLLVLMNQ